MTQSIYQKPAPIPSSLATDTCERGSDLPCPVDQPAAAGSRFETRKIAQFTKKAQEFYLLEGI